MVRKEQTLSLEKLVSSIKDKGQRARKRLCKPGGRFVTEESSRGDKSECFSSIKAAFSNPCNFPTQADSEVENFLLGRAHTKSRSL